MKKLVTLFTAISLMGVFLCCTPADEETAQSSAQDEAAEEVIEIDRAQEILDGITMEEKVGQMFFVRYPDDETAPNDASEYSLGGYILFGKDFQDKTTADVINQIQACQDASSIPMLIGVDEEGGLVNRVSRYTEFCSEPFKSPQELYAEGGYELIVSDTAEKCELLSSLGINVNLAPVCDVSEDSSSFIYDRTFGGDALATSEYVTEVVNQMSISGMGSVLKHFPGYGDNGDTHTDIIVDDRALEVFENSDFLPFKAGIAAGANMVLVSHNIVNAMDSEYPASLSSEVHRILREDLGFDGVIMTDDLSMEAITQYTDGAAAAVQAVKAGNDMLCVTDYQTQIPTVIEAVNNGEISEETINASAKRIIQMKLDLGIIE